MKIATLIPTTALLLALGTPAPAVALSLEPAHGDGAEGRHHVGLFLGGATRFEDGVRDDETGLAIGGEYEYRLNHTFGIGGFIEGIPTSHVRDFVIAAPLTWHPGGGLKFSVAPGVEWHDTDQEFLVRFAAGYDFHVGEFTIGPDVSVDLTHNSRTIVYGLFGGWEF